MLNKGMITTPILALVVACGVVLTGCTSAQERRDYRRAQVDVVTTQVEARSAEGSADAAARAALYAAMAEVARSAPDSADAIAVALAISSVQEEESSDRPLIQLHREQNEAVELAKAVAPALISTVGTVAVAGYQASVNKAQSDNAAAVAIADSATNADIMRSVTTMATTGLSRETVSVNGDYTTVGGDLDQSSTQSTSSTSEASTSTTTTTTTTTDSNNQTTYTTTDGTKVSLEDIRALIANNLTVTVLIDDEEVEVTQCENGGLTFGGGSC